MKKMLIAAFSFSILIACNNSGSDTTEKKDSSTTTITTGDSSTGTTTTPLDQESSNFMQKATIGSMAEVQEGELAKQKGVNQSVKDFGAMMVHDHSAAVDKLKGLATARNVSLPTTLTSEEQKMSEDLGKKTGKAFDKAYIDAMVEDHEKDIKEFEDAEKKVTDGDVKAFITTTLPTLRTHLDSAKAIQKRIK